MRIVAIETSGQRGSLATLSGESAAAGLVGQTVLPVEQRSAQSLAPALRELLARGDWRPESIGLVVVTVGPGSFTGLRIGVTTAKTLAYACGAEIVGVNTLAVLAEQALAASGPASASESAPLWTVMDAQRGELFVAKFELGERGGARRVRETAILTQEAWLAELRPGEHVTGPAVGRMSARLPAGVEVVSEEFWQPTAAMAGRVGWQAYCAGRRDDVWKLAPNYYRLSAAEEKAGVGE